MAKTIKNFLLPTNWASYLINGDSSGLDEFDIVICDDYCKDFGTCFSVSEDSFTARFQGLITSVSEYSFVIEQKH